MISITLLVAMVVMFGVGLFLMMDRSLTRILLGFLLVGNATNLLIFMMSGSFGSAPIVGDAEDVASGTTGMSDPLPQAFILTAIVITFGVTAFVLALMYRSWKLDGEQDDTVFTDEDDQEIVHSTTVLPVEEVLDSDLVSAPEFDSNEDGDE